MNRELDKQIVKLATTSSGCPVSDDVFLEIFAAMLDSRSQSIWNLIPPVLEAKPPELKIPIESMMKYYHLIGIHLRQSAWIKKFASDIRESKIPIILLKGHGLWGDTYSDNYPRLSSDIDILILKQNLQFIEETLFKSSVFQGKTQKHSCFLSGHPFNVQIEIHTAYTATNSFDVDFDAVWSNSRMHPVFKDSLVRCMSPEDSIIHIVIHSFNHHHLNVYMAADLIRLFAAEKIDSARLIKRSIEIGCYKLLLCISLKMQRDYGVRLFSSIQNKPAFLTKTVFDFVYSDKKERFTNRVKPLFKWMLLDKRQKRFQNFKDNLKTSYRQLFQRKK